MSLLSVLKIIGHDANTFIGWVEKAAPIAGSVISVIDPPLAPVIKSIEAIIVALGPVKSTLLTQNDMQILTQALTIIHTVSAAVGQTVPSLPKSTT